MEFKLLAIRALSDCSENFKKNLEPGLFYKFYQEYDFEYRDNNTQSELFAVNYSPGLNPNFFLSENPANVTKISISAIVGKNGTGKSTITELLYAATYLIALQKETLRYKNDDAIEEQLEITEKAIAKNSKEIEGLFDKNGEIPYHFQQNLGSPNSRNLMREHIYRKLLLENEIENKQEEVQNLRQLLRERRRLRKEIRVELIYQISRTFFSLKIAPNGKDNYMQIRTVYSPFSEKEDPVFAENTKRMLASENHLSIPIDLSKYFFYTIALNYSHYALNAVETGVWIDELFHKNDGYQTPIVLNPMRENGDIKINTENHLVRSRLMATLFAQGSNNELYGSKRIANSVDIKLDENKFRISADSENIELGAWKSQQTTLWPEIEPVFLKRISKNRKVTKWDDHAKDYILRKLEQIVDRYPPFYKFQGYEKNTDLFRSYLRDLKKDTSHISFKFHQAINFLKYDYAMVYAGNDEPIKIMELKKSLGSLSKIDKIINYVPPSFLKVDVLFSDEPTNSLSNLSSGEKQTVYSLSSIGYHLRYLDSVTKKDGLRYKYQYINIIFDEIELYYHPELQRNFVNGLLNTIQRIPLKTIESINCLFLTHSPFILSDIPAQNVLMLELDPETKHSKPGYDAVKTFAANIHDLLANEFFMHEGFMGEFAKRKINEVIDSLQVNVLGKKISLIMSKDVADEFDSRQIAIYKKEIEILRNKSTVLPQKTCEEIISIVGEPILHSALQELYHEAFEEGLSNI